MKKNVLTYGLMLISALGLLTNCTKETTIDTPEDVIKQGTPFELFVSTVDTKTSTTDGSTISWVGGTDKLNVFHAETGETSSFGSNDEFGISADDEETGRFTGTLTTALEDDKSYDWYVLYPYNSHIATPKNPSAGYLAIGSSGKSVAQKQTGNDSKAHLAGQYYPLYGKATNISKGTTPDITLNQALSIVKVHVTNKNSTDLTVASVSFKAPEDIVGTYYIDFSGTTPGFIESNADYVSDTAELTVTGGTALEEDDEADFYIAIKPFTAAASATLTVSVNGYEKTVTIGENAVEFKPGKIKTINFDYDYVNSLAEPTDKTGWYKVVDVSWLSAGDRVAIVASGSDVALGPQASNNRTAVSVTKSTDGEYATMTFDTAVQQFILEAGSTANTFAFWQDNGDYANQYIYAASSSSNNLKSQSTKNDNASFSIAIDTDANAALTANGSNTRNIIRYNNSSGSSLFSCYANGQNAVSIYKYYGGSTPTCAEPAISISDATVTITSTMSGCKIYYTTDGTTDPTTSSTLYSAPFNIEETTTVKAIAVRDHYNNSSVASQQCVPVITCKDPVITGKGTSFEITCETDGATIYYATSTVSLAALESVTPDTEYTGAVSITETTYVKAYAAKTGCTDSNMVTQTCEYNEDGSSDYTSTFTSAKWASTGDFGWTSGKDGAGFSNNGIQVTSNTSYTGANGTTNKTFTNVSQVVVTYNTNKNAGSGTLDMKIGSNTSQTKAWAYSGSADGRSANFTCVFDVSNESGAITLTANTTTNSIYIVSVTVTAKNISD